VAARANGAGIVRSTSESGHLAQKIALRGKHRCRKGWGGADEEGQGGADCCNLCSTASLRVFHLLQRLRNNLQVAMRRRLR